MTTQTIVDAGSDHLGLKFFSKSPFRSWPFLTTCVLFLLVILGGAAFLINQWANLNRGMKDFFIILVYGRGVQSMWWALLRHRKLRNLYDSGKFSSLPTDSPTHVALDVAAIAILDDLFFTYVTLLFVFLLLVIPLHLST